MEHYERAWLWLEALGGGLYGDRQNEHGRWECTVGGLVGMSDVTVRGVGDRHADALVSAVQELRAVHELVGDTMGPVLY